MLIDTHAHLNFPNYNNDLPETVKRAKKVGVEKIICVSSSVKDSQEAIEIAKKYKNVVFAAVGIHPQQTDPENSDSTKKQIEKLAELAHLPEVVAVGECGLDFSPAPPGEKDRLKTEQFYLFKAQIKLAKKLNLPILVHSREAFTETMESLSGFKDLKGVFHCYSGGKKGIEKVNSLGFFFGFDGNLTYDEGLQNVAKLIPLERIVLETDCPFLAPVPFRGQRSEPAYVKIIAKALAEIKGVSLEKIAQITRENTNRLLHI